VHDEPTRARLQKEPRMPCVYADTPSLTADGVAPMRAWRPPRSAAAGAPGPLLARLRIALSLVLASIGAWRERGSGGMSESASQPGLEVEWAIIAAAAPIRAANQDSKCLSAVRHHMEAPGNTPAHSNPGLAGLAGPHDSCETPSGLRSHLSSPKICSSIAGLTGAGSVLSPSSFPRYVRPR
jgi:hypothetical protein